MESKKKEYISIYCPRLIEALERLGVEKLSTHCRVILQTAMEFNLAAKNQDMKSFKAYAGEEKYTAWGNHMKALMEMKKELEEGK